MFSLVLDLYIEMGGLFGGYSRHIDSYFDANADGRNAILRRVNVSPPSNSIFWTMVMPLKKSASKKAVGLNIKTELKTKPRAQAIAIALSVQRRAKKRKK